MVDKVHKMIQVSRRRTLALFASVAGLAALPAWAGRAGSTRATKWTGSALGADATIVLDGVEGRDAEGLLQQCVSEMERLERIFSLYRPDSTLSMLNRNAVVSAPEQEFVELLSLAKSYAEVTGGAFDPTVQPIWDVMAHHFATDGDTASGNIEALEAQLAAIRPLVDYRRLHVEADRVSLETERMAVTLNGIAQGYITDRIANLLRRQGFRHVLIDLGEQRALGSRQDGRDWQVGIASPERDGGIDHIVDLQDGALATSGGYGHQFDEEGRYHHLYDPRRLDSANDWQSITVKTETATEADALSTAFSAMSLAEIATVRKRFPQVSAVFAYAGHRRHIL